ncbi:hypothetical protein G7084_04425 [Weissella coleopterorum]|uniref:DNA-directed RNA polymerase beta subunit n=1 Tax=Weissella coleopterorum TaxID=2714949 RepID=A0A6G8AZU9_9LACO|nr:hypothetical protein [Weissella coleopterorum]QIL50621.1 hypothetical protein G7084_04425 [Weissella coleopterorum]
MADMSQTQMERAKQFFEHEYQERGMVKWQGYYLSDHTENVSDYTQQRKNKMDQKLMPEMTLEEISSVLFAAYANQQAVSVQERAVIDGIVPAIISGVVKGYDENNVYIGGVKLNLEDINWANVK